MSKGILEQLTCPLCYNDKFAITNKGTIICTDCKSILILKDTGNEKELKLENEHK